VEDDLSSDGENATLLTAPEPAFSPRMEGDTENSSGKSRITATRARRSNEDGYSDGHQGLRHVLIQSEEQQELTYSFRS